MRLKQRPIFSRQAGQVGCEVGGDLPDGWRLVIQRGRGTGEVHGVEPAASRLTSAHVAQGPRSPRGDEALEGPCAVEAVGVYLEEPTQRLLCGVFKVMDHTTTCPPDHPPDDAHKLDNGDAEGVERVAGRARWVRRWVNPWKGLAGITANTLG